MKPDINPAIFREYDIRGIVDKDLTVETVKVLAQGIIRFLREKDTGRDILIGRDNRHSSRPFRDIVVHALVGSGYRVVDVGEVPTPVLYFALRHFAIPTGIMITGSHNPPSYNGFKVAIDDHCIWGTDIRHIYDLIREDRGEEKEDREERDREKEDREKTGRERKAQAEGEGGSVREADAVTPYVEEIAGRLTLQRKLKVVTDAGNGMAGGVAPKLLRKMGVEVIELFSESDGTYPNHHPDPTQPGQYKVLMETVRKERADVGLAYDGDADRLGAVDENGRMMFGDEMLILFSREILEKHPGATICMEVKCSQALVEDIEAHGGRPHMTPTGHSIIEAELEKTNALLAGEMSGHIYFNDEWYGFDDSIYAGARLLRILSNTDRRLSTLLDDAPKYFSTPEIRIKVPEEKKFEMVKAIKEAFKKDFRIIDIDGVRFLTDDGWGLVRASNTQPALVVRAEAKTEKGLEHIRSLLGGQLARFDVSF
ncbi:MAG: phosphomannomutase/phosphoglucomutase [DPANN group archaeon]|nr:phosphomannomutase/phosphoglucomutase [DPANN group archaeon]